MIGIVEAIVERAEAIISEREPATIGAAATAADSVLGGDAAADSVLGGDFEVLMAMIRKALVDRPNKSPPPLPVGGHHPNPRVRLAC